MLFIRNITPFLLIGTVLSFLGCKQADGGSSTSNTSTASNQGIAQWARTVASGSASTYFNGVVADPSGYLVGVGSVYGTEATGLGDNVTAGGAYSGNNALVVRYNASGTVQWAQTTTSASAMSQYQGVAVDSSGNVYAAGYIDGTGSFGFGNTVTATGTGNASGAVNLSPDNAILVKYSASGTAQWARAGSATSGMSVSLFRRVAVDSSGDVYAVGAIYGTGTYDFGSGVTAAGPSTGANALVVKYNASGTPQWARTVSTASGSSYLFGLAVDGSDNVYVSGYAYGTDTYDVGNGVTVAGPYAGSNALLIKYNASGSSQWAATNSSGASSSEFLGVGVDPSGNVYAIGELSGTTSFGFGNGVTATGTAAQNSLVVRYSASGTAQWARTVASGTTSSRYWDVATDDSGQVYVAGYLENNGTVGFGNAVTATGPYNGANSLLVKYNAAGTPQWARSVSSGTALSTLYGVMTDSSGNVFVAGQINGTGTFGFGNNVTATATGSSNLVLVKYQ